MWHGITSKVDWICFLSYRSSNERCLYYLYQLKVLVFFCNTWHVLTLPMTPTRCAHFHSFGPCLELLSVCNLHQTEIKTSCECEFPSTSWPLSGCSHSRKRGVEGSVSHLNFPMRLQTDSSIVEVWSGLLTQWLLWYNFNDSSKLE